MKTNMQSKIVILVGILFMAAALMSSPATAETAAKVYNLKMPINANQNENYYKIATDCANKLKVMSNGRLNIRILPINQVVPIAEAWDAVAKGTVEMAHVFPSYHVGKMPAADIESGLPFTYRNEQDLRTFWHDYGYLDFLNNEVYPKTNTYVLGQVYFSGYQLWLKKPVKTIEDLQKMKVRTAGALSKLLGKCGIPTTFIAPPEIYTALSTGVLDGAANGGLVQGYDLKYYEVAKYLLSPKLQTTASCSIYINRDLWNSLPEDLKLMLKTFAVSFNDATNRDFDEREIKLLTLLKQKEGVSICSLDNNSVQQLDKAAKSLREDIAKQDAVAAKGIELLQKFLNEHEPIGN